MTFEKTLMLYCTFAEQINSKADLNQDQHNVHHEHVTVVLGLCE